MEHVKKQTQNYILGLQRKEFTQQSTMGKKEEGVSSKMERIHKLFLRFQGMYFQKWTSQISTEELYNVAVAQWHVSLNDISDEAIAKALNLIAMKFSWPPSIAEFREQCLSVGKQIKPDYKFELAPSAPQPSPLLMEFLENKRQKMEIQEKNDGIGNKVNE